MGESTRNVETTREIRDLLGRVREAGWEVRRDPDARSITFWRRGTDDQLPRAARLLMAQAAAVHDLLLDDEVGDRIAGPTPPSLIRESGPAPEEIPLVVGGQGHSAEDIVFSGRMFVAALVGAAAVLALGGIAVALGWAK